MVALTGIERAKSQFSWVQFGLSVWVYVQLGPQRWRRMRYKVPTWQRGGSAHPAELALGRALTRRVAPLAGSW